MKLGCSALACILFLGVLLFAFTACAQGGADAADTTVTTTVATTVKTTAAVPSEGWITADSMRVRSGAGLSYEVIGGITGGERVEILGKTGDWYQIRFGDGVGYVSGQYLTFTEPTVTDTTGTTAGTTA